MLKHLVKLKNRLFGPRPAKQTYGKDGQVTGLPSTSWKTAAFHR